MELDAEHCYRALECRDARFDGRFFTGVLTTGVYCRPICPARTPKRRNLRFFACAAAAEEAGFRPCRRCRPDAAPGTPAWLGTSATVSRALRLIAEGALDDGDTEQLGARLGLGGRQLRRLFATRLGASPAAVARTRRTHFARRLIDETDRPMTEVAFGAGFRSVRQFNQAIRETFAETPSALRGAARREAAPPGALELRLSYRAPYDWSGLLRFLAAGATPHCETVQKSGYRRSFETRGRAGALEVRPVAGRSQLALRLWLPELCELIRVVERVRRVFDLSADPLAVEALLRRDVHLAARFDARAGLRIPGAWSAFELVVRALAGGRRDRVSQLVRRFGTRLEFDGCDGVTHVFPRPETLADADLAAHGLPPERADALRKFAGAVAIGRIRLDAPGALEDGLAQLGTLPGLDADAAQWIALRALGETDAFPERDASLRRAYAGPRSQIAPDEFARRAQAWRPWRGYAAVALATRARR
jgi:AraC family transcriptional regulator of adaptative response / DNA-3-methyladenine glycosylase II